MFSNSIVIKKCDFYSCNNLIKINSKKYFSGKGKYCSKSCSAKHMHNNFTKEDFKFGAYNAHKSILNKKLNGRTLEEYCLQEIFIKGVWRSGRDLKKYLLKCGFKEDQSCEGCGWLNKNIYTNKYTTELDHIDGDKTNNLINNLRFLCPNCHSLTPTFRGANVKNRKNLGLNS